MKSSTIQKKFIHSRKSTIKKPSKLMVLDFSKENAGNPMKKSFVSKTTVSSPANFNVLRPKGTKFEMPFDNTKSGNLRKHSRKGSIEVINR